MVDIGSCMPFFTVFSTTSRCEIVDHHHALGTHHLDPGGGEVRVASGRLQPPPTTKVSPLSSVTVIH
jgi:hypothetical protein